MRKKLHFKKIATSTLLLICCYIGFQTYNQSETENPYIDKKREVFNKFLDNHPYNNSDVNFDDYKKIPKKDRPDLAAEQNYLMMLDPNTLTVPYEQVAKEFELINRRFKEIKKFKNAVQHNSNSPTNNTEFFEINDNVDISEAITVNGKPIVWKERGPDNVGGRTRAILWDPNDATNRRVFAAGVTGGIWVNDNVLDPNSSWRAINDILSTLSITYLVADPNNSQVFYASTGEGWFGGGSMRGIGIFKSTDGGNTWNLLSSTTGSEFAYVQKIEIASSGTILAATRGDNGSVGGVFRSTDDGTSFTRVLDTRGVDIEIAANGDIYASRGIFTTGSIFKSTDDGVNWTDVTPPGGDRPGRIEIATAPTNANIVYAIASNTNAVFANSDDDTDWVQKSTDGGDTWTNLPIPVMNQFCGSSLQHITRGQSWYDLILAVSPTNPDVVIIGGVDMAKSEDGGQSWTQISRWSNDDNPCDGIAHVHADIHNIVFRPNHPSEALIGSDGGIDYSTNLGVAPSPTFEARDKNFTTTQFYAVATDNVANSDYYIGGTQDNGSQQLRNDLGFSSVEVYGGDGAFAHVDQLDRTYQLVSSQNGRAGHSSNGGASFSRLTTLGTGNFINQSDYDNTTGILYSTAAVDEIALITNLKSGNPDSEVAKSLDLGGRQTSAIRANTNTENRLFVGTEGGRIYRIDDANADTPEVTEITNNITTIGNVSSIDIGSSDMELIATYSNFGIISVWYSIDGGATWVSKDEAGYGLPNIPIRWALFNPNNTKQVLLATELGVWSTNDITITNPDWEPSNEGLANVRCDMIQYREIDKMIVVATHGRGFYTSNIFTGDDDTDAPVIASLNPSDDGTLVAPLDVNLEVQFNEPINAGTGSIKIYLSSDDSLIESIDVASSQVNLSGSRAIINPTNNLTASASYYVLIDAGAFKDNFNNTFAGIADNTTWNFTTFDGDESPVVAVPIPDFSVNENAPNEVIDLTTVFNDVDNDNAQIMYSLVSNSNSATVNAAIVNSTLTLSFLADKIGTSEIVIQATSNGKTVNDIFNAVVNDTSSSIFAQAGPSSGSGLQEGTYNDVAYRNIDDFIVPGGQSWNISTITTQAFSLGDADLNLQSVEVIIYNDNSGTPDTSAIANQQTIMANQGQIIGGTQSNTSLTVRLNTSVDLTAGTYWISIHPTFNVGFGTSATTGLYAWFRSNAAGNALISVDNAAFGATGREMLFAINGAITITDAAPEVANPIADVSLSEIPSTNPMVIDLSSTFTDNDNDDSLITLEVIGNTDTEIVSPSISGKDLSLNYSGIFGATTITLRATSNGLTVEDSFEVNLLSTLYDQIGASSGAFLSQTLTDRTGEPSVESADNFTIANDETWDILRVSVEGTVTNNAPQSAFFKIFEDDNGLPGTEIFNSGNLPTTATADDGSDFKLTLSTPKTLTAGTYWISVQAYMAFQGAHLWRWSYTTPEISNDFVSQDLTGLTGTVSSWASSGENGALIFTISGQNKKVLSTSNFNSNELRVLENPTNGLFNVKLGSSFNSRLKVNVYDTKGRLVKKQSIVDFSQPNFYVDLTSKANGIYIMRVSSDSKSKTFKLIKQ